MQLQPFPYHLAVAGQLQRLRPDQWQWFAAEHLGARYQAATAAALDADAVPLKPQGRDARAWALGEAARDRLGLAAPLQLHRLRDDNAAAGARLVPMPSRIVVVLSGRALEALGDDAELRSCLGREIARFHLFTTHDGDVHAADRMLHWMASRDDAVPEVFETARRFAVLTEAACDIGGLLAGGDPAAAVRALFRTTPGARAEHADQHIAVAREKGPLSKIADRYASNELSARAVALAQASPDAVPALAEALAGLVPDTVELGALDLPGKERLAALTRTVLDRVLSDPAANAAGLLPRARAFFPDYAVPPSPRRLAAPEPPLSSSVSDYLAYLLLDLSAPETGARFTSTIAAAATAADELGIGGRFRDLARQELRGRRGLQAGLTRRAA
jgi:hypothetical protein